MAAWDSRLPQPRAPQLCPSSSKGMGAQPCPGNLDVSDLLAVQGAGRHGPIQPRAQQGQCSLPAHVHLTHVLLLIITLAEGLLWDRRVTHGQQGRPARTSESPQEGDQAKQEHTETPCDKLPRGHVMAGSRNCRGSAWSLQVTLCKTNAEAVLWRRLFTRLHCLLFLSKCCWHPRLASTGVTNPVVWKTRAGGAWASPGAPCSGGCMADAGVGAM